MMRRLFIYIATFFLCLSSCHKDEDGTSADTAVKLKMSMSDYSLMTFVRSSHIWAAGDRVRVYDASQEGDGTIAGPIGTGMSESLFMCTMPLTRQENTLVGIYPVNAPAEIASGRLTFTIPQEQDGTLMDLQAGKTAYGKGSYQGGNIALKPLYKVLNVYVDRSMRTIGTVTVKAKNGEMIAGEVSLDIASWQSRAMSASVTVTLAEPLSCLNGGQSVAVMVADNGVSEYVAEITTLEGETFMTENVREGYVTEEGKSYDLGISQALFGSLSKAEAASMPAAGVNFIEVTMNTFWRGYTEEQCYSRARSTLKIIEETEDLEVWSVHLPFSGSLDISVTDEAKRAENVRIMSEMIRLAGEFRPTKLVLHPSSEPIKEEDRAARLACSKESIGRLLPVAKEIGAQLCIENLPRTCLGRTSSDMLYLIEDYPEVMVCFDSNHLLIEDHNHFFSVVGDRIGTIHASDYDKTDEKHWMPGLGVIDWPLFLTNLMHYGYEGVFMTEVKSGTAAEVAGAYENVICVTK